MIHTCWNREKSSKRCSENLLNISFDQGEWSGKEEVEGGIWDQYPSLPLIKKLYRKRSQAGFVCQEARERLAPCALLTSIFGNRPADHSKITNILWMEPCDLCPTVQMSNRTSCSWCCSVCSPKNPEQRNTTSVEQGGSPHLEKRAEDTSGNSLHSPCSPVFAVSSF